MFYGALSMLLRKGYSFSHVRSSCRVSNSTKHGFYWIKALIIFHLGDECTLHATFNVDQHMGRKKKVFLG